MEELIRDPRLYFSRIPRDILRYVVVPYLRSSQIIQIWDYQCSLVTVDRAQLRTFGQVMDLGNVYYRLFVRTTDAILATQKWSLDFLEHNRHFPIYLVPLDVIFPLDQTEIGSIASIVAGWRPSLTPAGYPMGDLGPMAPEIYIYGRDLLRSILA